MLTMVLYIRRIRKTDVLTVLNTVLLKHNNINYYYVLIFFFQASNKTCSPEIR